MKRSHSSQRSIGSSSSKGKFVKKADKLRPTRLITLGEEDSNLYESDPNMLAGYNSSGMKGIPPNGLKKIDSISDIQSSASNLI